MRYCSDGVKTKNAFYCTYKSKATFFHENLNWAESGLSQARFVIISSGNPRLPAVPILAPAFQTVRTTSLLVTTSLSLIERPSSRFCIASTEQPALIITTLCYTLGPETQLSFTSYDRSLTHLLSKQPRKSVVSNWPFERSVLRL